MNLSQVRVVEGPADQARAAVETLASFAGKFRGDQITVGVPDETLVPQLERQFHAAEVPCRYGPGRPLAEFGPVRLVAAVAAYLERGQYSDFAALVRHADLNEFISRHLGGEGWLSQLDAYYSEHLPSRLTNSWLGPAENCGQARRAFELVTQLVAPLEGPARPLTEWSRLALDFIAAVYGNVALDRNVPAQRATLEACETLRSALLGFASVPPSLAPKVTAAVALLRAVAELAQKRTPAPANPAAVELLGWLELPLDDAPALVVTSLNEGYVPDSVNSDLFLPNTLRTALGLEDNTRRFARDAYALCSLLASRESLTLIVGRRNAEGDPLVPSRLLMQCPPAQLAQRVLALFGDTAKRRRAAPRASDGTSAFAVPSLAQFTQPVESLSVTDFKAYLSCPYRFFLGRVLHLSPRNDAANELDGAAFGNVLHAVLRRFGEDPNLRASTAVEELAAGLNALLEAEVLAQFGEHGLTTVRVQVEQMRLRLATFAEKQAEWAAAGWRIEHVERQFPQGTAVLEVDGQPLALRGRIDRIDFHEAQCKWAVLDYKSSDKGTGPEKTHRDSGGNWLDLQLPLYRHLVRSLGLAGQLELGYILLPRSAADARFELAAWSEADLNSADVAAHNVVRHIRARQFSPPAELTMRDWDDFAAICQNGVFDRRLASPEVQP